MHTGLVGMLVGVAVLVFTASEGGRADAQTGGCISHHVRDGSGSSHVVATNRCGRPQLVNVCAVFAEEVGRRTKGERLEAGQTYIFDFANLERRPWRYSIAQCEPGSTTRRDICMPACPSAPTTGRHPAKAPQKGSGISDLASVLDAPALSRPPSRVTTAPNGSSNVRDLASVLEPVRPQGNSGSGQVLGAEAAAEFSRDLGQWRAQEAERQRQAALEAEQRRLAAIQAERERQEDLALARSRQPSGFGAFLAGALKAGTMVLGGVAQGQAMASGRSVAPSASLVQARPSWRPSSSSAESGAGGGNACVPSATELNAEILYSGNMCADHRAVLREAERTRDRLRSCGASAETMRWANEQVSHAQRNVLELCR